MLQGYNYVFRPKGGKAPETDNPQIAEGLLVDTKKLAENLEAMLKLQLEMKTSDEKRRAISHQEVIFPTLLMEELEEAKYLGRIKMPDSEAEIEPIVNLIINAVKKAADEYTKLPPEVVAEINKQNPIWG